MKKLLILSSLCVCLLLGADNAVSQEFPKVDVSVMDVSYYPPRVAMRGFAKTDEEKNAKPIMRVTYSRPLKNDRIVFGELQKYGEMWRVGANESTEILFHQDVTVGGTKVSAGRYTLNAMVNENEWTVYISSELDAWGHYTFDADKHTVAKVTVPTAKTSATVEALSIIFQDGDNGANMVIAWDDTMASVPISF